VDLLAVCGDAFPGQPARGQLEAAEPLVQKIEAVGQELIQLVAHDLTIESLRHEAGIAEH